MSASLNYFCGVTTRIMASLPFYGMIVLHPALTKVRIWLLGRLASVYSLQFVASFYSL